MWKSGGVWEKWVLFHICGLGGFLYEMVFVLRPRESEGASMVDTRRGRRKCKGPEVGCAWVFEESSISSVGRSYRIWKAGEGFRFHSEGDRRH
jgi:hypothetical protein